MGGSRSRGALCALGVSGTIEWILDPILMTGPMRAQSARARSARIGSIVIAGMAVMIATATTSTPSAWRPPATMAPPRAPVVLVYYDMEGLAGQEEWRTASFQHPEAYRQGRELLVGDVNAVVDGLFAGGAGTVRVVDAHGSGNDEGPDLPPDRLDRRAETVFSDHPIDGLLELVVAGACDAVVLVAMHAKTGRPGFMAHTFELGTQVSLNGHWITESEAFGYAWGTVGVPVIFVSGDDRLHEDVATAMPGIEYVEVKHAVDAHHAIARPLAEARRDLREGAARAIRNRARIKPLRLATPIAVRVRAVPPASLAGLAGIPGVAFADSGVSFAARDLRTAFTGIEPLLRLATAASDGLWETVARHRPDAESLSVAYLNTVVTRAFDYESGRWRPPAVPPRRHRYHGAN